MKNQIVNSEKEELCPVVEGSYMIPFLVYTTDQFSKRNPILAFKNAGTHKLRIKNFTINANVNNEFNAMSSLTLFRCNANNLQNGIPLLPTKKDSSSQYNSNLYSCQYGTQDSNTVEVVDYTNRKPIITIPFCLDYNRTVNGIQYNPINFLDVKDHLILNPNECLFFWLDDDGTDPIGIGSVFSGLIEWDEIKVI